MLAGFRQQEADAAVGELGLEPQVQALAAGHGTDAAGAVPLAVPAVHPLLAAVEAQGALVTAGLEEVRE